MGVFGFENDCGEIRSTSTRQAPQELAAKYNGRAMQLVDGAWSPVGTEDRANVYGAENSTDELVQLKLAIAWQVGYLARIEDEIAALDESAVQS